jgi:hypothetical protein
MEMTPASKHVHGRHSGLDAESSTVMDSRFRGNDRFDVYCCRCNNDGMAVINPFESGYAAWKTARMRLLSLMAMILLLLPVSTQAQTEWVTFRDEQFRFRFIYPPDWQIGTPVGPDVRGKILSPKSKPIAHCVAVIRPLPGSSEYTQKALNKNLESEVWSHDDWIEALSVPPQGVIISEMKRIRIDNRPAQFAVSVVPFGVLEAKVFLKSMNFITMSPGYVWRFGCGAAGPTAGDAAIAYDYWEPVFQSIFSSFIFEMNLHR